jgi:putative ABC transport system permease protein
MARRKLNTKAPPKWAMRFFRWYCHKDLVDGMEGDMLELYKRRNEEKGTPYANMMFVLNVIRFFQPFAIKQESKFKYRLAKMDMLFNYLKIAYRNLRKSKVFTAINVFGLAIGISGFVLMMAFVLNEMSFDKFHTKADRIYRLTYTYESNGGTRQIAKVPYPIKPIMLSDYPEVESLVRFYRNSLDVTTVRFEEKNFTEEDILFVDPEVFEIFDFKLEVGNPKTALEQVNSIVMTRAAAFKYFGNEDPMGKIVEYKNGDKLEVTGIMYPIPDNSHIKFDMLVPLELQRQRWMRGGGNNLYDLEQDWKWSGALTYILVKEGASFESFNAKFYDSGKDFFGRDDKTEFTFSGFPLEDIHLYSHMSGEMEINGNVSQVIGFGVIALLILVIACINFINLSTARSAQRAKEVGLRKVMGALKPQLVTQFISESMIISFLATGFGILLVELIMPYFNQFMEKDLSIPYFEHPAVIPSIVIGSVLIGLLSGLYPAYYLSRFQPSQTLKGSIGSDGRGNVRVRRLLVGGQLIISNLLIISILVVQAQLNFLKNKDLGFNKDQVMVLKHGTKIDDVFDLFNARILTVPSVEAANLGYVAGKRAFTQTFKVDGQDIEAGKSMGIKYVSYDFAKMFDLDVVEGRFFSKLMVTDSANAMILNESAVKQFGWTNEQALGKQFSFIGGSDNKTKFEGKIIGVLKDANFESLYQPIKPSVFKISQWGDISIKLNVSSGNELRAAIEDIEEVWDEIAPTWPFEYSFLDQELEAQYAKEDRLGRTVKYFTLLAIFIACLGLFGLASFTVQQKTKEIGVRKVLGASIYSILLLISKSYLPLIIISFLVATPLGYLLVNRWLQDFEFRITITPSFFVIAGIISMGIAGLAISSQSLKAATSSPTKTMRYD